YPTLFRSCRLDRDSQRDNRRESSPEPAQEALPEDALGLTGCCQWVAKIEPDLGWNTRSPDSRVLPSKLPSFLLPEVLMQADAYDFGNRPAFQVLRSPSKNFGVVPSCGQQTTITIPTREAPNNSGFMAVIDRESLAAFSAADPTTALLGFEELVPLAGL